MKTILLTGQKQPTISLRTMLVDLEVIITLEYFRANFDENNLVDWTETADDPIKDYDSRSRDNYHYFFYGKGFLITILPKLGRCCLICLI